MSCLDPCVVHQVAGVTPLIVVLVVMASVMSLIVVSGLARRRDKVSTPADGGGARLRDRVFTALPALVFMWGCVGVAILALSSMDMRVLRGLIVAVPMLGAVCVILAKSATVSSARARLAADHRSGVGC